MIAGCADPSGSASGRTDPAAAGGRCPHCSVAEQDAAEDANEPSGPVACLTDSECDTGFCDLGRCAMADADGPYGRACTDEATGSADVCGAYRCQSGRCR